MSAPQDPDLVFEHLGPLEMGDRMVVADAACLSPRFEGLGRGALKLQMVLPVVPGQWEALVARSRLQPEGPPSLILLCHESELETAGTFDDATSPGLVSVDSGRLMLGHAGLRDDPNLQVQLPLIPPEELPGVVLEAGAAVDVVIPGPLSVFTSTRRPATVVFVPTLGDGP